MMLKIRRRHTISRGMTARDSIKNDSPMEVRPTKLHELCAPPADEVPINADTPPDENCRESRNDNNTNTVTSSKGGTAVNHITLQMIQRLVRSDPASLRALDKANGCTPLHLILQHPRDFKESKLLDMVSWIIQYYPALLQDCCGPHMWTPLHVACAYKAPKSVIQYLIKQNVKLLEMHDLQGNLPLHLYARKDCDKKIINAQTAETLKLLVEKYPEALETTNVMGQNPFHLLLFEPRLHGLEDKVKVIQLQRELNGRNTRALFHSMLHKPEPGSGCIRALRTYDGFNKQLPLHYACKYYGYNSSVVVALVQACPEALDYQDDEGYLPIHTLLGQVTVPAIESVQALVDLFIDSLERVDEKGNCPLHIFLQRHVTASSLAIIQYLTTKNADIVDKATEKSKDFPLHIACQRSNVSLSVIQYLCDSYPDALLAKNAQDKTPLQLAKESDVAWKVMQYLYRSIGTLKSRSAAENGSTENRSTPGRHTPKR